jgi:hypothetical protein
MTTSINFKNPQFVAQDAIKNLNGAQTAAQDFVNKGNATQRMLQETIDTVSKDLAGVWATDITDKKKRLTQQKKALTRISTLLTQNINEAKQLNQMITAAKKDSLLDQIEVKTLKNLSLTKLSTLGQSAGDDLVFVNNQFKKILEPDDTLSGINDTISGGLLSNFRELTRLASLTTLSRSLALHDILPIFKIKA